MISNQEKIPILIIPGGGPGVLPLVSAASISVKHNFRIILGDANPAVANMYLPEIDAAYRLPFFTDSDYIEALASLIRKENVQYMYSGLDEELPLLAQRKDVFEQHGCKLLLPPAEALSVALDKSLMWTRLEHKIRMPETIIIDDNFEPDEAYHACDGNTLIKATNLRGGRAIYLPEDREEFDFYIKRARRQSREQGLSFIVQRRIYGNEFNVSSLHDGADRTIFAISRRKFEDRAIKSTTMAAVIERRQDVIDLALEAVREIGLMPGFNNTEIIVDERDDLPYLIEINGGRSAAQDQNIVSSCINIADLMLDVLAERSIETIDHPEDGLASLKIRKDVIVPMKTIENIPAP